MPGAFTSVLEARSLGREYRFDEVVVHALCEVNLSIRAGEFLAIQGASGSGKSTLLALMAGLDRATRGEILFRGERIDALEESSLAAIRRRYFGFVFQAFYLVPSLTLLENVSLPLVFEDDPAADDKAMELLRDVGLEDRANFLPDRVSGGEKQRAAIARALGNNPLVVFADEPTGNLDSANGERILDLLVEKIVSAGRTLVLVSHDPRVSARADRVATMTDGKLAI